MDWWAFVSALHASCVDKAGLVSHEVFKRVDLRDRFFFFFFGYNARGFRRFGTIEAIPPETDGWPAHRFWFKGLLRGSRRSRQLACATKLQLKYFRDASTIYETQPFYIYIFVYDTWSLFRDYEIRSTRYVNCRNLNVKFYRERR